MSMPRTHSRKPLTRWLTPAVAIAAGIGYLVAGIVGSDLGFGIFGLALMVGATALFLVLTRYSETAAGLLHRNDERINSLDLTASAFAGMLVIAAVLVAFVVEIARGKDGSPYYQLGALGGLGYLAALIYLRFRR